MGKQEGMRHVTIAEKSLLIGDDAATTLLRYAALVGKLNTSDVVDLRAYGADGELVEASFLLNSGTVMMVESSRSELPEPDNGEAVQYMTERLAFYSSTDLHAMGHHEADGSEAE